MWDEVICIKELSKGEYPAVLRVYYVGQQLDIATIAEAGIFDKQVMLRAEELLALAKALQELKERLNDDREANRTE